MKHYRFKDPVEALRWTDTDADREAFCEWFSRHGAVFETYGPRVKLLHAGRDAMPGDWIVRVEDAFEAYTDALFRRTFEETP